MSISSLATKRRRLRGFTILELVIVLVVLAALAGIVIGLFPNLLTKTHAAVATTNLRDLNQAMQRYSTLNLKQPSRFDSLIEDGGTNLYAGLPFDATAQTLFTARVPTADEAEALTDVGITQIINGSVFTPGTGSATFDYPAGAAENLTVTTPLLFVDTAAGRAHLHNVLNIEADALASGGVLSGTYVVFGVGPGCTLIGNANGGAAEAPLHFGENESGNPKKVYSRYFAVYRVDTHHAQFVGVAAAHDDGLVNSNQHLAENYE